MTRVRVNASRAIERMRRLEEGLDKELDDAAEDVVNSGKRRSEKKLQSEGHVASRTGIESLTVNKRQDHDYELEGRTYLKFVDRGTAAHSPEVTRRLEIWAAQEGWRIDDIVEHIEEQGTEAHPWINPALDPLIKTVPEKVASHVRLNIEF